MDGLEQQLRQVTSLCRKAEVLARKLHSLCAENGTISSIQEDQV